MIVNFLFLDSNADVIKKIVPRMEATHVMEVAQLLLSLLHSWGLDPDLDKVCETHLGLLRPMVPVSYGVLSKAGYMSLMLPTWQNDLTLENKIPSIPQNKELGEMLPPEIIKQENLTRLFTSKLHWELSTTLTSIHLLSMVAMSNTLMSMNMASFIPSQERNKKYTGHASRSSATWTNEEHEQIFSKQQAEVKQGWSLLSMHHCILLPEKIDAMESKKFKRPQVEMMARRWQHHCLEIRESAQQILLGELGRMGRKGRKALVESWAQYLPLYTTTEPIVQNVQPTPGHSSPVASTGSGTAHGEQSVSFFYISS